MVKKGECFMVPNLASFLSLAAYAGAESIGDFRDDATWAASRAERLADEEMDVPFSRTSRAIYTLPGVALPTSPSSLVTPHDPPDPFIEILPGLAGVSQLWAQGRRRKAHAALHKQLESWRGIASLI
jgi:hypothetical protein